MSFQQPLLLWTFLSLIPLLALYFLRVRPRPRPTTALFLWQRVLEQKRHSALWQRLRDLWSLLLMALAFSAISLAIARPQWSAEDRTDLLLLIDCSLSMQALDGGVTRLSRAQRAARDMVTALDGNQRAAVASVGQQVEFLSHFSDSPRDLQDAINAIQPTNEELTVDRLTQFTPQQLADQKLRIFFFSDGAFDTSLLPQEMELVKVGSPAQNMGIVAAEIRSLPGNSGRLGLFFQLHSSGTQTRSIDLILYHHPTDGVERIFKVIPVQVEPGMNRSHVETLENAPFGHWLLRIAEPDALAADNEATLYVPASDPIPIHVLADDRFFLENSVRAFADQTGLLQLQTSEQQTTDDSLVLAKQSTPAGNRAIIFQPAGESPFWSALGDEQEVIPKSLDRDHPVVRYVDIDSLSFAGARQLTAPAGSQVWVEGDTGIPLIYWARNGERSAIVFNLDPAQANFYYSAWFPVLVHSAATYLAGKEVTFPSTVRPGQLLGLPQIPPNTVQITPPDGKPFTSDRNEIRLQQLGWHTLQIGHDTTVVGCSTLSARESDLDNTAAVGTARPVPSGLLPAAWLTWLAIGLLCVESLFYHRRKVG